MPYTSQATLEDRWPQLQYWSDDNTDGTIDSAVVTDAIQQADAIIDRAASQQYEVPLTLGNTQTAEIVDQMSGLLSAYYLAVRTNDTAFLDLIQDEYKETTKFLEKLAAGKFVLEGEDTREVQRPSGEVVFKGDTQTATGRTANEPSNLQGW